MTDRKTQFERIADLIRHKQYDRARLLLQQMGDDPTAQAWLARLEQMDPHPRTTAEFQAELVEVRQELAEAEHEIETTERTLGRQFRFSTAVLIFFSTLLGSLLGAAADVSQVIQDIENYRAFLYPTVCLVGSDTILGEDLGLSTAWETEFEEQHKVRLSVSAIGSTAGYNRARDGQCAHLLAMSEPMDDAQYAQLVEKDIEVTCAAEIGFDVIVFVTDINNPIQTVSLSKLRRILTGELTTWDQVSPTFDASGEIYREPITILARPKSGTTAHVLDRITNFDSANGTVFPPSANYVFCADNAACLDLALSIPGSIYWVSASWVASQPEEYLNVFSLVVDEELPPANPLRSSQGDAAMPLSGLDNYPIELVRALYLYVIDNKESSDKELALAQDFMVYARGVHGQTYLDEVFHTHFASPRNVEIVLPGPFAFSSMSGASAQARTICLE